MCRSKVPLYDCIEISPNEHLLKCHARIQKRLSGERAVMGPPAKRHLNGVLLAGQYKLIFVEVCTSKVPLYDFIQSLRLKFYLMGIC